MLERYREAAGAFRRLREIAGPQPDALASEATALAMAGGGNLSGRPARLVQARPSAFRGDNLSERSAGGRTAAAQV